MGLSVRIYCDWKIGRFFGETFFREEEKKRTKAKKKIVTRKKFAKKSSKSSNFPNAPTEDKQCNTY